jgi:hypothetical protein
MLLCDGHCLNAQLQIHVNLQQLVTVSCILLQVTTPHFDHQAWQHAVAAATSLTALRSSLAQLEDALSHEGRGVSEKGKKTRGQAKAESERIPLLSPAWKVLATTPCVKGAWLTCGAEVPAAAIGMEGLLQPVPLVQPAAAVASGAPDGDAAAAAGDVTAEQQQQREAEQQQQEAAQQRQQRQQQQHEEALASLSWLPATAAALSLRLAALDAVLQYPQLGPQRVQLTGREVLSRYR